MPWGLPLRSWLVFYRLPTLRSCLLQILVVELQHTLRVLLLVVRVGMDMPFSGGEPRGEVGIFGTHLLQRVAFTQRHRVVTVPALHVVYGPIPKLRKSIDGFDVREIQSVQHLAHKERARVEEGRKAARL